MVTIELQTAQNLPSIENLLDNAFGPDRRAKASYSLREGVDALSDLSFVARRGQSVVGTLRFWQVGLKDLDAGTERPALYLGPIAISSMVQGQGIGSRMLRHGIASAMTTGIGPVFLVGSRTYYERHGFEAMDGFDITLPGGRDGDRLQVFGSPVCQNLPKRGILVPSALPGIVSVRAA